MVLQNLQVLVLNTHKQKVPLFSSLMNHFYKSGILYNIAFYFNHKIFVIQQHATEKGTKKKKENFRPPIPGGFASIAVAATKMPLKI